MSIEDRDGRQEARDDRQQARDDRQEARDARAGFTRDDLDPLAVQVVALREDLAAYRWAIEKILRRRLWTSIASVVVGLALIGFAIFTARILLEQEEERAGATLELARLESCRIARTVQGQVVAILADLEGSARDPEWLARSIERLSVDPCAAPDDAPGGDPPR